MGHMSVCLTRDGAKCHPGESMFDIAATRAHHVPSACTIFASRPHVDRLGRARYLEGENGFNDQVHASHAWHTSGKGTFILTTDYLINLFYQDALADGDDTEAVMNRLIKQGRKDLKWMRQNLIDVHGHVPARTMIRKNPKREQALAEAVTAGADLSHFSAINFDCVHQDEGDRFLDAPAVLSEAYHDLMSKRPAESADDLMVGMHGSVFSRFSSLNHQVSLGQDDVLVMTYDHLVIKDIKRLKRARRTPADELLHQWEELDKKDVPLSNIDQYVLLREFFASQGYEFNL